jgi:hypothetical protein
MPDLTHLHDFVEGTSTQYVLTEKETLSVIAILSVRSILVCGQ